MPSSISVFKQMFLQKRHYINLVLLIQLFAIVFLTIFLIIQNPHGVDPSSATSVSIFFDGKNIWSVPFAVGIITTVIADIAFCGLLCWQNQKINMEQTWNLVPMVKNKLYSVNLLSSIFSCVYIFVIQIVFNAILGVVFELSRNANMVKDIQSNFLSSDAINEYVQLIIFLFLLVSTIFTYVDFTNFSSHAISEWLPVKSTKWVRMLIIAILIIVASFTYLEVDDQLQKFTSKSVYLSTNPLWIVNVELLLITVIFLVLNIWLNNKYVETKRDN